MFCCFKWKAVPIDAIDRHMSIADKISKGLRPALSTTNNAAMLLINCTNPTKTVARCSFIELPARSKFYVRNNRMSEKQFFLN